jgi:hypothetical protein
MADEGLLETTKENFDRAVETHSYWSVVDAQSSFDEWVDEYYSPDESVNLDDPIIYGAVTVYVRRVNGVECEEEGAGDETEYSTVIGKENKATSLKSFQKALLKFTAPIAAEGDMGMIYHLKRVSTDKYHVFMNN